MQVFFDANIWIEYCWASSFSGKGLKNKKKNIIPIHRLNSRVIKVVLTTPLLYEITSHFKDYYLLQDVIEHGYSTFEFSKVKRDFSLKRTDRKKVDKLYNQINSYPFTKGQLLYDWLDEESLSLVFKLTTRYDLDFIDCLHFVSASISKCNIFVTKDDGLIQGINKASKTFRSLKRTKIMKNTEFLSKYKNSVMKS